MLLVPRTRGGFEGIEVNALGFAGALLVRSRQQLGLVRQRGPLTILRSVAVPRAGEG
jgi:ATP adenylyltransferase